MITVGSVNGTRPICQPFAVRTPGPNRENVTPFVDFQNLTSLNSGTQPLLFHETTPPESIETSCLSDPSLNTRPIRLWASPPRVLKSPPTRSLPSPCKIIPQTVPSTPV